MISTLVTPPVLNTLNYPDVTYVYGEPLITSGFENKGVINGIGLVTRGLVWQYFDTWFDKDYYSNISTTWSAASGSSITTNWTSPQFGVYGDFGP